MSFDPGIGSELSSRPFQRFMRKWGALANIRSIMNWVQPVTVVERYRDDQEGSLYAIHFETASVVGAHPAVMFGTTDDNSDTELLGIKIRYKWTLLVGAPFTFDAFCHIFTTVFPYNPVSTASPAGVAVPGLLTNWSFTRGTGFMIGGYNAAMPAYVGWTGWVVERTSKFQPAATQGYWYDLGAPALQAGMPLSGGQDAIPLSTPLRIYGNRPLAVQMENPTANCTLDLAVSMLYRERRVL